MSSNEKFEQEIHRTRKRAKWGCFAWFAILILVPIIWFISTFSYEMYFKEETLLISHSPDNINTIEVVEKGGAFFFVPSSVRIKYDWEHEDRSISNDGATLNASNVSVSWKNNDEAIIFLNGDEQEQESVEITFNEKNFIPGSLVFIVIFLAILGVAIGAGVTGKMKRNKSKKK